MHEPNDLDDDELLRYARHILLDEWGIEAQKRLKNATVVIIGLGGLGCPAALYLASAGVGRLVLVDGDSVEPSNLQRQILHSSNTLGMLKVSSAKLALGLVNPKVLFETHPERFSEHNAKQILQNADVVLDCSDNFATRMLINKTCVELKKPLISGAAIRYSGQVMCFDLRDAYASHFACYNCLFPDGVDMHTEHCATTGVFAPLTGIVGTMQAGHALNFITQTGTAPWSSLSTYDAKNSLWRTFNMTRDPNCAVCRHS